MCAARAARDLKPQLPSVFQITNLKKQLIPYTFKKQQVFIKNDMSSTSLLSSLRRTGPSVSFRGDGTRMEDTRHQETPVNNSNCSSQHSFPENEQRCLSSDSPRGRRSIPMTPKSFYPSIKLSRIRDVEERVLRFLADVRLGRKRSRCLGDEKEEALLQYWKQFSTQAAAFEESDRLDPRHRTLRTFSLQMTFSGRRKFLVTSYAELWSRYALMPPHCRHFYEIVRENQPCHLYFDLEFDVSANPSLDGQAAVDALLSLLDEFLMKSEIFRKQIVPDIRQVFELDSSTDQKFSRHLLIRFPGAAFKHNGHVGALVKDLADRVWSSASSDPRAAMLIVRKGQEQGMSYTLMIDTGVYSRNRAFRLFLSSKAGKNATLQSTGRYATAGLANEQLFMATLVGHVVPEALLLHYNLDDGVMVRDVCPLRLRTESSTYRGTSLKALRPNQSTSPYPALDEFVRTVSRGGIRSWMTVDDGVILYNIKDNRYCGNIGREHRSNGVFYVVDLHQKVWYQKCHDPECRSYRSPLFPLPPCICDTVDHLPSFLSTDCNAVDDSYGLNTEDRDWEETALRALMALEQSYLQQVSSTPVI